MGSKTKWARKHYNEVAPDYAMKWRENTAVSYLFNCRRQQVLEMLKPGAKGTVLDVGCGPGVMTDSLLEQGHVYFGVDISDGMIAQCARRFRDRHDLFFAVADVVMLPFRSEFFDIVLCLGVLEYVDDLKIAIRELGRVVKSDGKIIFSMMNRRSPYRTAERVFHTKVEPYKHFSEAKTKALLRREGLEPIDCIYYDFNLLPRPLDARYPNLARSISNRFDYLGRGRLRWLGTGFIVSARKARCLNSEVSSQFPVN